MENLELFIFSILFVENITKIIFSMPTTKISKKEIVKIALQEFLQQGIQSFTIKHLTELTGISTKTVYKLFGDKTALLKTCLDTHYSRLTNELLALNTDNEIETILNMTYHIVALEFEVNPQFYAELNTYYPNLQSEVIATQSEVLEKFAENIQRGIRNGSFLPEINPDVCIIACQQLYSGITREKIYGSLRLSGPELIKNTIMIYLKGMCTPSGLQKLKQYEQSLTK